jgi:hypothetical protein
MYGVPRSRYPVSLIAEPASISYLGSDKCAPMNRGHGGATLPNYPWWTPSADKLGGGNQLALWRRRLLGQPVAMVTFAERDVDVARRLPRSWQAQRSHLVVVPVDAFQGG